MSGSRDAAAAAWWRDPVCLGWIAVAMAIRVAYAWNLHGLEASDPVEYDTIAWNVAEGRGFTNEGFSTPGSWVRRPPLFVFLVAAVYRVFGHDLFAARMAQCVVGMLLCVVTCGLASTVANLRSVRRVAAAAAVYPYLVYYSGYLMSENLAALFFVTSLWRLAATGGRATTTGGMLVGLAALTRSSFLGMVGPIFFWLRDARGSWSPALRGFAALLLGVMLVLTPWLARNIAVTGKFVLIQSTGVWGFYQYHLWFSEPDFPTFQFSAEEESWQRFEERNRELFSKLKTIPEPEQDAYFRREALQAVISDPVGYLRSCFRKFVWLWRPSMQARVGESALGDGALWISLLAYVVWLPVFVFGLACVWRQSSTGRLLVWGVAYVTALHTFYWYGAPRFRFPIYPIFLIACVVALERIHERASRRAV